MTPGKDHRPPLDIGLSDPATVEEMIEACRISKSFGRVRAVREVSESFDQILLILNFVSGVLIAVIAVVVGLIHNIFFAQRMDEFAVLLAIGVTRRRLFRKVVVETAGIMGLAWAAGLALGMALLAVFRSGFLEPRGIFLPLLQASALGVSAALPFVALIFAATTVFGRLKRLDPVAIIERRG